MEEQPALPTLSNRPLIGFLGTSPKAVGGRYFEGFPQGMSESATLQAATTSSRTAMQTVIWLGFQPWPKSWSD
jgi:hypothetical protein